MTIEFSNIMHVTGTKTDLYSPSYFKEVEGERKPVNPFTKWVNGRLFILGITTDEDTGDTQRVVIDLTAAREPCSVTADSSDPFTEICTCLQQDVTKTLYYTVTNPVVPPSKSYTAWQYSFQVKEHEFSNWIIDPETNIGKWDPSTDLEYQYLKDKEVIAPTEISVGTASEHKLAEVYKKYYLINCYDYPENTLVSLTDVKTGDDLYTLRQQYQTYFEERYKTRIEKGTMTVDVKLCEIDFTQADQNDTATEHDTSLMGYWLGKYTEYPKMFSVDQNENIISTYGSASELNMEGDFEYRHSLPDAVFGFKKDIVTRTTTLPICNGLCCYPRVLDGKIYASQGQRLSYNKSMRDRRWILVDFEPVGGCSFIHLSELEGSLSELTLPSDFDNSTQSLLLVIKGRLFLPGEFELLNHKLIFDLTKFKAVYELDRKLCRGDVLWNSTTIENRTSSVDQKDSPTHETIHVHKKTSDTAFTDDTYTLTEDEIVNRDKTYYVLEDDEYRAAVKTDFDVEVHPVTEMEIWGFKEGVEYFERTIKYYILFNDEFYPVDVKTYNLVGEPIDPAEYTYDLGFKDENDQPILFSTFYEYVDKEVYEIFDLRTTGDKIRKTYWNCLSEVTVTVENDKLNLKDDDNSFLIIINKPNLQIVRHICHQGTWPMTRMARGVDSFAEMMKNDFDQQARGLLFDESTRSVMDYSREVQTMTFYADKIRKWGISNIHAHNQRLIAVTDESSHNLMSARGFVLDNVHEDKFDHVIWPRLSILDFIFRG